MSGTCSPIQPRLTRRLAATASGRMIRTLVPSTPRCWSRVPTSLRQLPGHFLVLVARCWQLPGSLLSSEFQHEERGQVLPTASRSYVRARRLRRDQMKKAIISMLIGMAAIPSCRASVPVPSFRRANDSAHIAQSDQNSRAGRESTPRPEVRRLRFSGYDWTVKSSDGRVGPGPNYFSDSNDNVLVDAQGRLHLLITQPNGRWYCAEVISIRSFGYGTYRFYLDTNLDNLDPQIVLGMFTWNDAPAYNHREIDIEVSRW